MTKQELVLMVKEEVEKVSDVITKKAANDLVDVIFKNIKDVLKETGEVALPHLGKLVIVETAPRKGVSKLHGVEKEWSKPAGKKVKFKTTKSLKEEL